MLLNLFLVIGILMVGYFFIRFVPVCLVGGASVFISVFMFFLWAALLPLFYLSRYKWLWIIQIPLLAFYLLFTFHESWYALPWILIINTMVYLLVHSVFRLTRKANSF